MSFFPAVLIFGRHAKKLDLLRGFSKPEETEGEFKSENFQLETVDVSQEEGQQRLSAEANTCDVVVEATGSPQGFEQAMTLLQPLGTLVLKSTCAAGIEKGLNLAPVVINELKVVGSRCGPIDRALDLLSHRGPNSFCQLFPLVNMVDVEYDLEHIVEAFERASQRGALKVIINFA